LALLTSAAPSTLEVDLAVAAARAAAACIRSHRPTTSSPKRRNDIVTDVDLAAEQIILDRLRQQFCEDTILAEEAGLIAGRSARTWCVDPLDGTANFAAGLPHYAVAVTLLDHDEAVLAVIHDVARDETFTATSDGPTTANGRFVVPRCVDHIEDALIALQLPEPDWRADSRFVEVVNASRGSRVSGSEALDFAWTASGLLDACLYRRTAAAWDWTGGELLVSRAGGVVACLGHISGIPLMVAGAAGAVAAFEALAPWHPT
jgi:myo-inositol-1(or 4)-monophosphatase